MSGEGMTLRSEFGYVRMREDHHANGPRLRIESVRSGHVVYLDPLELESLAHWRHEDLAMIVMTKPYHGLDDDPR